MTSLTRDPEVLDEPDILWQRREWRCPTLPNARNLLRNRLEGQPHFFQMQHLRLEPAGTNDRLRSHAWLPGTTPGPISITFHSSTTSGCRPSAAMRSSTTPTNGGDFS